MVRTLRYVIVVWSLVHIVQLSLLKNGESLCGARCLQRPLKKYNNKKAIEKSSSFFTPKSSLRRDWDWENSTEPSSKIQHTLSQVIIIPHSLYEKFNYIVDENWCVGIFLLLPLLIIIQFKFPTLLSKKKCPNS